ncbi:MAG: DUF4080 domain-containing protein [Spirochaetes bacterium]|nr:MAG: DUF4080 domain-containing protein [Spirochaetota bacterium]
MVLLLGINARFTHSALALYSLRRYCDGLDYEIFVKECSINMQPGVLLNEIASRNPAIIGISVYIWNAHYIREILPQLARLFPRAKIVLGGPEVSYNSEEWLDEFPEVTHIIQGAGEAGFRRLLENNGELPERVVSVSNPIFSSIPFPYTDLDLANFGHRYVYYESSRGCPFRCTYCLSSRESMRVEYRDPEQVCRELESILRHEPKIVKFLDRSFNARVSHSRAIWKWLIEKNASTKFHFEIHPQVLEEEDWQLLSRVPAGRFQFEVGVQTINSRSLRAVKRAMDWETVRFAIHQLISRTKISVHLDLIMGLPCDTIENARASFNEIYRLGPQQIQVGFLKVLPGTELRLRSEKLGIKFNPEPPYEVISTPWISSGDLDMLRTISRLINNLFNNMRFPRISAMLETMHPDPYSLYADLAVWMEKNGRNPSVKNAEQCAQNLVEYALHVVRCTRDQVIADITADWEGLRKTKVLPKGVRSLFYG